MSFLSRFLLPPAGHGYRAVSRVAVNRRIVPPRPPQAARIEDHYPNVAALLDAGDRLTEIVRAEVARQLAEQNLIDEEKLP